MRRTYFGKNAYLHVLRHPIDIIIALVKGEAPRHLRTKTFRENIIAFEKHLMERGYPQNFINNTLSEVKFQEGTQDLIQRNKKKKKRILPCVTQYHPAVPNLKEILTRKYYLTAKPVAPKHCSSPLALAPHSCACSLSQTRSNLDVCSRHFLQSGMTYKREFIVLL